MPPHSNSPVKRVKKTGSSFPVPPSSSGGRTELPVVTSTRYRKLSSGTVGSSTRNLTLSTPAVPSSPSEPAPNNTPNPNSAPLVPSPEPLSEPLDPAYVEALDEERVLKVKRDKYDPWPLFLSRREEILSEFLRLEGRGVHASSNCAGCEAKDPIFRCLQCTGDELFCQACIVRLHARNPLHWIEKWVHDSYFICVSLKSLGLRVQLGHPPLATCQNPAPIAGDSFVVIDVNGVHGVAIDFCECATAQPHFIQLLRHSWYPASVDRPRTAATFNVLKLFDLLNFESKASVFEFYNTLVRLSDNTGLSSPKDRYQAFLEMIREFRHLKSLKRAGRNHKPGGAAGTCPGECAVLCPACPQPGRNLPPDWQTVAKSERYKYALFLAIDANFRLKRRNISSEKADPSFGDGFSYFVPHKPYQDHLAEFDDKISQKRSNCNNHKAVNQERAGGQGVAATGVCAVDCARHDMKRPLAVGDLHKGERYVNVDYIYLTSLQGQEFLDIVTSYDIICQWRINLWNRIALYPSHLGLDPTSTAFRFLVPKFHLPAHVTSCQTNYSFNFAPGVGRTDGEGVERGWSRINPIATSIYEMGPGHRRDTLDAHFADTNHKKSCLMPVVMLKKGKEAVRISSEMKHLHNQFTLGRLDKEAVARWEKELEAWELDPEHAVNPFEKRFKTITQDTVRKRLIAEDEAALKEGKAYALHDDVSASGLIALGLDLENEQRQIAAEVAASGKASLLEHTAKLQNRSSILNRKIVSFTRIQQLYIPSLDSIREKDDAKRTPEQPPVPAYSVPLYLPSALSTRRRTIPCDSRLLTIEFDLRVAQAQDALDELRNALRLRSYVYKDKDLWQRGQRRNLRSLGLIARLDAKVSLAASKYRTARSAIISLKKPLKRIVQDDEFPELRSTDICGLMDDSVPEHMKKSQAYPQVSKNLSWIWKRLGSDSPREDDALQDDLRIEFCKSKKLSKQWSDEVGLLEAEMDRVKRFFRTRWEEWTKLAMLIPKTDDPSLSEGRRAYALEQAAFFDKLRARCEHLWQHFAQYKVFGRGEVIPSDLVQEERSRDDQVITSSTIPSPVPSSSQ